MPSAPLEARLRLAVQRNDIKTMQDLIKRGADINAQDNLGYTPLIIAARLGRIDCARILLGHGAEIDKADHQGHTALLWASFYGYTETATLLAGRGADPDVRGKKGTALTCATFFGREEIVRVLLQYGADIDKADPNGLTPVMLARQNEDESIGALLHEALLKKMHRLLQEAARRKRPRPKFKP
ncbi:MAG: ankyrin repeat domain-containing protein [Alphaproteobacteria bacterium]|nr:ankyrin repeat domain-containing protein [Alphaproteobacteria bacterium]